MAILIGLIPAFFWGILPIWIHQFGGGNFRQQLLGTSIGMVILATGVTLIWQLQFNMTTAVLFFLSGFCWSFGQGGQYHGFETLGVSTTMPLSTALQIIGNSVIGGLVFGEWHGVRDIGLSLVALVVIIAGVLMANGKIHAGHGRMRDYLMLIASTAGYWGYSAIPHYAHVASNLSGFFPQALGMLCAALVIGLTQPRGLKSLATMRNISSGFIYGVAAAAYLVSLSMSGLVNAFILSQLNVIVSTLLGGVVLHEFVKGQLRMTILGLVVLLAGAVGLVML
ncbi:GRP family sugar transporter [Lacticaseibacillus sp. GG6-2]